MEKDIKYKLWLNEKTGSHCVKNLKKHGFDAFFASDKNTALSHILEMVSGYNSFGFGGSSTTRDLGLTEELKKQGKTVYDHWDKGSGEKNTGLTDMELRLKQGRCDCFFCSANAISATGEIVNVDGVGNRNNAMSFGCPKVVIVAGINKVTQSLESALSRIREVAAPMRAKSLNMETPCAETGICVDCNSPQRICRITTILHRKPMMTDVSIVLINDEMGF